MQVSNLCYQHYRNGPLFFKNINFKLTAGNIHALHGKNGTGKSILLNLLSGKQQPYSVLKGTIVGKDKAFLIHQKFDDMIANQFSFEDNLKFACLPYLPRLFSSLSSPKNYSKIIQQFNIDLFLPVYQLSGGQRQILALLMALQHSAHTLLLDEPTATLDEENAIMVFDFLNILARQGLTFLIVCHDRELIQRYTTGQQFELEIEESGIRTLRQR